MAAIDFPDTPTTGQVFDKWTWNGTVWVLTAARTPLTFEVSGGPAQSVPASLTIATYPTEISDPFNAISAGVFTVPAGWGGRYEFSWSVDFAAPGTAGLRMVFLAANGLRHGQVNANTISGNVSLLAGSTSVVLAAGQTAGVYVYHSDAGNVNVNTDPDARFRGYYVGPT